MHGVVRLEGPVSGSRHRVPVRTASHSGSWASGANLSRGAAGAALGGIEPISGPGSASGDTLLVPSTPTGAARLVSAGQGLTCAQARNW